MPNWNSNYLTVKGFTPEEQTEFKERVEAEDLFRHYVPIPDEDNWYEWCLENWGTKWDISDPIIGSDGSAFTCYFKTAWAPPIAAFTEVSKRFPNATFELGYEERGCDFCGAARFKCGVVEEFDGLSPSALTDTWLEKYHPDLYGNEDRQCEAWELQAEVYGELIEDYLAVLLGSEPLDPAVIAARKEADAKAMEWMELALQQLREKQTA